jgi:hypothetical protein
MIAGVTMASAPRGLLLPPSTLEFLLDPGDTRSLDHRAELLGIDKGLIGPLALARPGRQLVILCAAAARNAPLAGPVRDASTASAQLAEPGGELASAGAQEREQAVAVRARPAQTGLNQQALACETAIPLRSQVGSLREAGPLELRAAPFGSDASAALPQN